MELIFLAIILVLFLLPSILIGRKQRQRQREVVNFQQSLVPGQRVVTAGGIVGTVSATYENGVDLEIAPNVVVTFDRMGILRSADAIGQADTPSVAPQQPAAGSDADRASLEDRSTHPENNSDNYGSGDYGEGNYGESPESKN